jgi:hypothetical protein
MLLALEFKEKVEYRGRRRNRRDRCSGYILPINDVITDRIILSITPIAILSVFLTRHCTDNPV